jgi:aryl-alcohol dehydrogenase-like predicted oxidoreductase
MCQEQSADNPLVASKCGFDCFGGGGVTNSASHIKTYIEGTIERLGFAPDLYYLHRIDPSEWTLLPNHWAY